MASLSELLGQIDTGPVSLLQATVIAITSASGTCTIRFASNTTSTATPGSATNSYTRVETGSTTLDNITGVRYLASASFSVGDTVLVLQTGNSFVVIGKATTSTYGNPEFRDGLELYQSASTPYIDFHQAASPAGDSNADYNVRLINDASGYLRFYGGHLEINGGALNDTLIVSGSGGNLRLNGRDGGAFSALYQNGGLFRVWNSAAGADIIFVGQVCNGTEWGLRSNYNIQGVENYAGNWFRNVTGATGWYSNVYGYGLFQQTAGWIDGYGAPNIATGGWVSGGSVACNGLLRVRAYTDTCHQIAYIPGSIGSPSNGTQSIDGPMLSGYNATALGSAPCRFNNIQFRCWDNGGDYRSDHYSPLHTLQGLFNDGGTKSFLIDHPVLGPTHHLQYCAIEGPSIDLIFRGKITLKAGKGVVNIDDEVGQEEGTFEALTYLEDRQFFLYNETGDANPKGRFIPGAGDLEITCADKTATIGWMIIAVRKAGLTAEYGLTADKRLMVEWEKNEVESSTTMKKEFADTVAEHIAELEQWKKDLPGSERRIDQLIAEKQEHVRRHTEGRKQFHANMAHRRTFWKGQQAKAKGRKKAKGRA